MMTVNGNGPLVEWAYKFEERVPLYTNLCALFWRTVLFTPLKIGAIGLVLGLLVLWHEYLWFQAWWMALAPVGGVAGLLGTIAFGVWCEDRFRERKLRPAEDRTLVYLVYRSIKDRYCPLIRID